MTTTAFNIKVNKAENKISHTSGLVTTTVLSSNIGEVENKISDHAKYITTPECNKLTAKNFAARLNHTN